MKREGKKTCMLFMKTNNLTLSLSYNNKNEKSIIITHYNKNNFVIKQKKNKSMYTCMIRYNSFPMGELICLQLLLNILVFNQIHFPVASNTLYTHV